MKPALENWQPELFKQLSNCYLLPDCDFKKSVVALEYLIDKGYPRFAHETGSIIDAYEKTETSEQLRVEFTRLFIGPYIMLAPPYESVYRDREGKLMGDSTMEVLRLYKAAGFDLADNYHDAPDHVATELEFLYILSAKQMEAISSQDLPATKHYSSLAYSLLADHLYRWVPELTARIEAKAESGFYKCLARITRKAIEFEMARCNAV
jgi:TorA maturation chaperone TorD